MGTGAENEREPDSRARTAQLLSIGAGAAPRGKEAPQAVKIQTGRGAATPGKPQKHGEL